LETAAFQTLDVVDLIALEGVCSLHRTVILTQIFSAGAIDHFGRAVGDHKAVPVLGARVDLVLSDNIDCVEHSIILAVLCIIHVHFEISWSLVHVLDRKISWVKLLTILLQSEYVEVVRFCASIAF